MASEKFKVVGGTKNFWIWSEDDGFDLTHPPKPTSQLVYPRIPLATRKGRITVDPSKTALVIVDMQNYFLSPLLGRPSNSLVERIYKNRLSGFWGGTGIEEALNSRGIRTSLFAGENTDQCVQGSMQDTYTKGWDCLMLSDACGTTSPEFATKCIEFNCENGWGFVLTCQQVADGVNNIQNAPDAGR